MICIQKLIYKKRNSNKINNNLKNNKRFKKKKLNEYY